MAQGSGVQLQHVPNPFSLSNWVISDVDTTVLEQHAGPVLRSLGACVQTIDLFELFKIESIKENPVVVILACVWPPMK